MAKHPEFKELGDGTFLVHTEEGNIHTNHIHVASDGETILSHKVNGESDYKYSDTKKDLADLYEEVTKESYPYERGWRPK